jgi:hypothetical protein
MKLSNKFVLPTSLVTLLLPAIASAQDLGPFDTLVSNLEGIINSLFPVATGLALLGFFFGLAKYIFQAGDDEAQEDAKQFMIYGVIALFLIASIAGIIELLGQAFGTGTGGDINSPRFN